MRPHVLAIGFLTFALAACSSGSTGNNPPPPPPPPAPVPPPAGAAVTFDIGDDYFQDPQGRRNANAEVTINAGETVGWRNLGQVPHTVTKDGGPTGGEAFDSGDLASGLTFTARLTVAGRYTFFCENHPATMRMSAIVVN